MSSGGSSSMRCGAYAARVLRGLTNRKCCFLSHTSCRVSVDTDQGGTKVFDNDDDEFEYDEWVERQIDARLEGNDD